MMIFFSALRRLFVFLVIFFAMHVVSGTVAQEPGTATKDVTAISGGTLTGKVSYVGEPVAPRKIQITKDVDHCEHAGGEFTEVHVGEDGGLADVVIEVQVKGTNWDWKEPEEGYVLRQKGCQFRPWLLVVPNGANVTVYNDDDVTHNVNTGLWNEMQASGATAVEKPISGRQGIRVSCNIHSWMEAWIYPARSPFYAQTTEDGKFEIRGIPPGKYRAVAWHPSLGRKKLRLEFTEGETTTEEIRFEAP
jgi:hypothetical protein